MKNVLFILVASLLLTGCAGQAKREVPPEDSALVALLDAVDECREDGDAEKRYELYSLISEEYENKNLSEQQMHYQRLMLDEALQMPDADSKRRDMLVAEAHQRIATAHMVNDELDSAASEAWMAYELAPSDTVEFRAQLLLLLCQICLQGEQADSARRYLDMAASAYSDVKETELYHISEAYVLFDEGKVDEMDAVVAECMKNGSINAKAELTRLLMIANKDKERWQDAFADAERLITLTDSISKMESSESMVSIHKLQHEQQMERNRAERATERATLYLIIIIVLILLLAASIAGLLYRKKAIVAHTKELEAMRLSEEAQASEEMVREENIQLQKLYYEHLYAIILPILNANRGKTGHIDLSESSWDLIEKNTDMVLPGFTTKLRRNHPTLTSEDVRFCCMIMMRVPNAVLADVYGIAASSVAVRKQRMKKKLDSDVHEQTIENYLNQYMV